MFQKIIKQKQNLLASRHQRFFDAAANGNLPAVIAYFETEYPSAPENLGNSPEYKTL